MDEEGAAVLFQFTLSSLKLVPKPLYPPLFHAMTLRHRPSELFIPSGEPAEVVLPRTTHLAIGAHQDDIEIFAYHGILECYQRRDRQFGAVTVTNGSGSPRSGDYAGCTDSEMLAIRAEEQRKAALIGEYAFMAQLGYDSAAVKDPRDSDPVEDLADILRLAQPTVLYLHNPFDKHETHVAVLSRCLAAVRCLPVEVRPRSILGCEVWRDLDWVPDFLKVPLDVGGQPDLAAALLGVFESQISGGKRYDLATEGRRLAHATFSASHAVDGASRLTLAIDMSALFRDDAATLDRFTTGVLEAFASDVRERVARFPIAIAMR